MENNANKKEQQEEGLTNQEQLAQAALGNSEAIQPSADNNNNDILTIPEISGTGSNPSSAAPHSLIVHEDENGEKKYEEGSTETSDKEQE